MNNQPKQLFRSRVNRIFAGVCGGFAEYFNIDVVIVRILFLVLIFIDGIGILLYLISLIVMRENPQQSPTDREKSPNTAIYWGIGLVLLGLALLSPRWHYDFWPFHFFRWYRFDFWGFNWNTFWPVVIILLGVLYLVHVLRQNDVEKSTGVSEFKLYRSRNEKMISGVCGGLATHLKIDPVIVRIGWLLLSLMTKFILGVVVYIIWVIIIPEEPVEPKMETGSESTPEPMKKKPVRRTKKSPQKSDSDETLPAE